MKVLIADDSPAIRGRLDSLLAEIPGVEIAGHAGDGEEFLAQVSACAPQVVILDGSLQPEGGLGLLRKLRSKSRTPAAYFFEQSKEQDRLIEALVALRQELA
jgi:DNA-binding NarL/FixJ family response regulator